MALDRKLAMFMKWMGWMRSPDGASIIWSSSATLRQLKPSAANSMVLRAALWCSSLAEHHRRSRWRYSPRVGMSMTATSLWRKTLRLDFVLCDNELQLVCEASVPSDPCNNKDAMKWECEQTEEQNKDCQQLSLASAGASLPKRFPCSPPSEWVQGRPKKVICISTNQASSLCQARFVDALATEGEPNGGIKYTNSQERYPMYSCIFTSCTNNVIKTERGGEWWNSPMMSPETNLHWCLKPCWIGEARFDVTVETINSGETCRLNSGQPVDRNYEVPGWPLSTSASWLRAT